MKKGIIIALSTALLLCLFPANAFASGNLLDEWLGKLNTITDITNDINSSGVAGQDGGFSAKELYERTAPKVVEILTYDASNNPIARGSGFFIDDKGTIVTNYHVIEDASSATAQTSDETVYPINLVLGYDAAIDLALLSTGITGNEYLEISDRPVETGDTIYTLGSALGLTGTFSDGLVSTASRVLDGVDYIQITAPISHGNSGGPLINTYGEVIGVNTMGFVDGQNINFAVNINELTRLSLDNPTTLEAVYYAEGGDQTQSANTSSSNPDVQAWYDDADMSEIESNDSFAWADSLRNDLWMAGAVDGIEDFDYYKVNVVAETDLSVILLPMYTDDTSYLLMAAADIDGNILAYSEATETSDGTQYQYLETHIDVPGSYYVVLCVSDDYPYTEPAYYQLNAAW